MGIGVFGGEAQNLLLSWDDEDCKSEVYEWCFSFYSNYDSHLVGHSDTFLPQSAVVERTFLKDSLGLRISGRSESRVDLSKFEFTRVSVERICAGVLLIISPARIHKFVSCHEFVALMRLVPADSYV